MAESLLRTFISVSLPKEIVNIKKMLQSTIDSKGVEIKWVRDGNMHLTLKFIGHTPEVSVEDINKTLKSVTEDFSSISLSIVDCNIFLIFTIPFGSDTDINVRSNDSAIQ